MYSPATRRFKWLAPRATGWTLWRRLKASAPDVVTMDVHMPRMDGFEATRQIMAIQPTPVVIVNGSSPVSDEAFTTEALEAGALAAVHRPPGQNHPDHATAAQELIQTVKLMSEVRVVTRRVRDKRKLPAPAIKTLAKGGDVALVAIGASTGGPPVLQRILSALPKDMPFPLVIVQHIAKGFTKSYQQWLGESSGFPLKTAEHGEYLKPGMGYIAPEGAHLEIDLGPRATLAYWEPEYGLRPSINYLFLSVARTYGPQAVGVLLTGMGSDGARALLEMRNNGALTIVQDEASSVVFGMAAEAIKLNAADQVLPPDEIAAVVSRLARINRRSTK